MMRLSLTLVSIMTFCACAPMSTPIEPPEPASAKAIWERQMLVIEDGIAFWEKRSEKAAYTPDQLAEAIEFFEDVTGIASNAPMTFIGPIPDENLKLAAAKWTLWYGTHSERLIYDPTNKRVIVR